MEVDEVFRHIGELGPEQVKLFVLLSLPVSWVALHLLVTNFIGTDPGWSCGPAQSCNTLPVSGKECNRSLLMLITDPEKKCTLYESGVCDPQFTIKDYTSIVTEWELICSKSSYPNLSQSGLFLGLMIGAWVFGILTDMYGRRLVLFIGLLGCSLAGIGYGLSNGFFMFALFRLLFGMMNQALIVSGYSLLLEVVGASKRGFVATLTQMFFSIGVCALVVLAYFIRSWRALCLVNALIGFTFLAMLRLIPESPRWLLIQGRENEARAVLAKIARGNGTNMTISKLKKPASPPSDGGLSTVDLFRGDVIRKRTLILLVAWFTNCVVYYGLSMNAGNLGGGRYVSLILSGIVELPGLYVSYQMLDRIGRKWSHGGLLMLGGMCCMLWALGHWADFGESVKLVLSLVGKCAVASSFSVIYLYSAELFPTEVRSLGLGVVSVASRIGGIVSPLILLLSSMSVGLPMLVMGSLGLIAGFLTLSLPETLNRPLPETLAELTH